jgi:tRNA (guanine-N7-)-methyltransferase
MRKKLIRFEENKNRDFIVEPGKKSFDHVKGAWNEIIFDKSQPIVLEAGCGEGDYTVELAKRFPRKNFIGTDIKGHRIWYGGEAVEKEGLKNAAFLRTRIELLEDHFAPRELSEIWITFPGPRPKRSEENRRLTNQKFLDIYKRLLKRRGVVHLKTDSELVYLYTKDQLRNRRDAKILADSRDVHNDANLQPELHEITTKFERKFLKEGCKIYYLSWKY